jgi:hypothetical protein
MWKHAGARVAMTYSMPRTALPTRIAGMIANPDGGLAHAASRASGGTDAWLSIPKA